MAWVEHGAHTAPELPTAAALMLEREALRIAQRLQERELRASAQRLVSAGDGDGRRLERDLHDGAQQRLLAVGPGLARARSSAPAAVAADLTDAETGVAALRDELRQVAHGIHSVTLAEGGLAEAVLALVQGAGGRVQVEALPEARAPAEAEAAICRFVAASLRLESATGVRIAIRGEAGGLDVAIRVSGIQPVALSDALAHAGARVSALGGSLAVGGADDGGASARALLAAPGMP